VLAVVLANGGIFSSLYRFCLEQLSSSYSLIMGIFVDRNQLQGVIDFICQLTPFDLIGIIPWLTPHRP